MKVFIISTPSQAFFLLKSFGLIDSDSILIVLKNSSNNDKKILFYLDSFQWRDIIIWDIQGVEKHKNYYKIFKFKRLINLFSSKYGNPEQVYMGSYDNLFQLAFVAKFEQESNIFLLYDGLQMVNVSNARRLNPTKGIRTFSWVFKLAQLKRPKIDKLTFISPLELLIPENDRIIILQKGDVVHPKLDMNLVYIVGQPLVDMSIIDVKEFKKMLKEIRRKYNEFRIEYIPHPKESDGIKSVVNNYFEILDLDKIFEEHYISSELFAGTIISFYSSILVNMSYLSYPSNIVAFKIHNDKIIRKSSILNIERIYTYFQLIKNPKFQLI